MIPNLSSRVRLSFRTLIGVTLAVAGLQCVAAASAAPGAKRPDARPLPLELDGRWIGEGVSFSPFRKGQSPDGRQPTDAQILEDLRIVSQHWHLIRMYNASATAEATLRLIREHQLPIRVILGSWVDPEDTADHRARNRAERDNAIRLANTYRDIVIAVNVGNETQVHWSGHRCEQAKLIEALRAVRQAIVQPVTTADDFNFWNKPEARPVAAEIDFIMLHAYAAWNGRSLDDAVAWTAGVYDSIRQLYPDHLVIFGETGWPTSHDASKNGPDQEGTLMRGEISVAAQERFLREYYAWMRKARVPTLLFEAFDEPWKGSGETGSQTEAEKHWGLYEESRQPKPSFRAFLASEHQAAPAAPADR